MRIMPIGHGDLSLCPVAIEIVFGASRSTFSACSSLLTRPYLLAHQATYVNSPWRYRLCRFLPRIPGRTPGMVHSNISLDVGSTAEESHADQAEELTAEDLLTAHSRG